MSSRQSIVKWGNSLAFRLPAAVAGQMGLSEGVQVTYTLKGRQLIVEAAEPAPPPYTKADLARALRKSHPRLVDFGKPRGKEEW